LILSPRGPSNPERQSVAFLSNPTMDQVGQVCWAIVLQPSSRLWSGVLFGFVSLMWPCRYRSSVVIMPVWRAVPVERRNWTLLGFAAPSSRCLRFVPVSSFLHSRRPRSHEAAVVVSQDRNVARCGCPPPRPGRCDVDAADVGRWVLRGRVEEWTLGAGIGRGEMGGCGGNCENGARGSF
jgi:hypothetical protein